MNALVLFAWTVKIFSLENMVWLIHIYKRTLNQIFDLFYFGEQFFFSMNPFDWEKLKCQRRKLEIKNKSHSFWSLIFISCIHIFMQCVSRYMFVMKKKRKKRNNNKYSYLHSHMHTSLFRIESFYFSLLLRRETSTWWTKTYSSDCNRKKIDCSVHFFVC